MRFLSNLDLQLTGIKYFFLNLNYRGVIVMESLANLLEILKYLLLATVGSAAMCLVVSMFGGLLERIEGTGK